MVGGGSAPLSTGDFISTESPFTGGRAKTRSEERVLLSTVPEEDSSGKRVDQADAKNSPGATVEERLSLTESHANERPHFGGNRRQSIRLKLTSDHKLMLSPLEQGEDGAAIDAVAPSAAPVEELRRPSGNPHRPSLTESGRSA